MPTITPIMRFLRALTPEQKRKFAEESGTTLIYLYQLGAQPRPNPALRLAYALVANSKKYGKKAMTPALTLDDLLVGAEPDEPGSDAGGGQ